MFGVTANHNINMPRHSKTLDVVCPKCSKKYQRVYGENGFGLCSSSDCVNSNGNTRLIRPKEFATNKKFELQRERIQAELSGKIVHRNSLGNRIT